MKKILLAFSILISASAFGQISNFGFGGVKVPLYMASTQGGSYALPVVFRAHITGLMPNKAYKYFARAISAADFNSTAQYPGAGTPIFLDSGIWKKTTTPSWSNGSGHDTFYSSGAGEYEGWFGFIVTSDSRFTPGKYVYPSIFTMSLSGTDSLRTYGSDSIRVLAFGAGKSSDTCTGIWGKSLAPGKSFVALYDNVNGTGRPLSMTMVEKDEISVTSAVAYYSSNVDGVNNNWGCIVPNDNANGVQRIENLNRYMGMVDYANTDADAKWGPSNKNTVNPTGGRTTPIALDENDAALVSPMIEFWARTSSTSESAGTKEIYVVRKYSNSQAQSVRIRLVGGTGTKATDFNLTEPRTITFNPGGQAYDTTKITITDDNIAEIDETVVLQLDQANNCVIGTEVAHTLTINDNDVCNLTLGSKLVTVKETAGTVGIKVKMDKAISNPSTLKLFVKKQGDTSYIPAEFSLGSSNYDSTFTLGKSTGPDSVIIKAKIIDDLVFDPSDTFVLAIRQKSGFAKVAPDSLITIVVLDNDGPTHIRFVSKSFTTNEKAGSVKVKVKIVSRKDASSDFTLRFLASASTATQGSDFTFSPTSQIISIDTNSFKNDTISVSVPIIDDNAHEATEKIVFNLGFLNNIVIEKPDSLTISLLDDDLPLYPLSTITKQTKSGKVADSLNVQCRVSGTVHGVDLMAGAGVQFTIMDKTAGVSVLSSTKNFSYTVAEGDSVIVQGVVDQIQGLVTMDQLDTIILIAKNKSLRTPNIANDVDETTESRMTKFNRVILVSSSDWPTSALAANTSRTVRVKHTDGSVDTLVIDAETNIDGTSAPTGYINVTGIGSQFDASNPYTGNYALMPRYLADIETATLPVVQFKKLSDTITELADSFTVSFVSAPLDENYTFDVLVKGGTAASPQDYDFTKRTISVIKNNSINPIKCNISDDVVSDGTKTVLFAIRNVVGPGSIGTDSVLTLVILDDEPSGVKKFAEGSIKMYPNPASGKVYIQSQTLLRSVEIYSADGRLVWNGNGSSYFEIPLAPSPGVYLVKITGSNGDVYSEPLMVK